MIKKPAAPKVEVICQWCYHGFEVIPSRADTAKYCSAFCANRASQSHKRLQKAIAAATSVAEVIAAHEEENRLQAERLWDDIEDAGEDIRWNASPDNYPPEIHEMYEKYISRNVTDTD